MNRYGNLYEAIYNMDNLRIADQLASRGKSKQPGVIEHRKNAEANLVQLHETLQHKKYKTSAYSTFKIFEPKEREIFKLPYFPDRIVHHAIMNVMKPIFVSTFTADSYSCIEGKGIHAASGAVKKALIDHHGTQYCLKMDIKKFYPSIDHEILKQLLRRKIKDTDLLWILDEIIDSAPGVPIGNYLSQYFANFYLTGFDHWIKEVKQQPYFFRYADDIVVLSKSKTALHALLSEIRLYLSEKLKLTVKENYQVYPVDARGIDFVGYVHFHGATYLRKSIKQDFARMMKHNRNAASIASYNGWLKWCNSKHLYKKLAA